MIGFNFTRIALREFSFLSGLGFSLEDQEDTSVTFSRSDLLIEIDIDPRDRSTSLRIGTFEQMYNLSEFSQIIDSAASRHPYEMDSSTERTTTVKLRLMADYFRANVDTILEGGPTLFARLREQRSVNAKNYALDVLASQIRPKAEVAFRAKDYKLAAELYGQIAARLTPSETMKLRIALARQR